MLAQYPAFGTFFVQSGSPSFASDLGAALSEAGISFHSVGPTRQAPVLGNEAVMPVGTEGNPVPGAADELRPETWTRLMVVVMRLAVGPDPGILLGSGP